MPDSDKDDLVSQLKKEVEKLEKENHLLKQKQVEISAAKELYLKIFQDFPALIWRANTDKLCDYFNTRWLNFTGRTINQEYGHGWADGVHPDDLDTCLEIYLTAFDKQEAFSMEYRLKNRYGEYRWIRDYGQPYFDLDDTFLGYIGACYDITESRRNEQRLEELSVTDTLTQTFNRLKLDSVLENEVLRAERYGHALSLIILDVDDFKSVNDTYDHQVGDIVLSNIAQLLQNNIRKIDTLGRWGGEEFMIVCPETDSNGAVALAEKLRVAIEGYEFPTVRSMTSSFGVATYQSGDNSNDLVKRADTALYRAKGIGKNRVEMVPE